MSQTNAKWMMVIPPEGAARQVGEKAWEVLCGLLPAQNQKLFDTKVYLDAFDGLLKSPTDDMVVDLTNQALVVQCLDFQATHILVIALSPITRFTVNLLRQQGITPIHWFIEDFREAKYWKEVLPVYRHFLAIQRGPVETACAEANVSYGYLPTAAILRPRPTVKEWSERSNGIAFIGFPSAYRIEVLEALAREGLQLKVAGLGWEKYRGPLEACLTGKGWFGPEEAFQLLENSRIGLHLPSENPGPDRGNSHVSPRVFDIIAAGCLLMSEDAPMIRETLKDMLLVEFRGPVEAVSAARKALAAGVDNATLSANRALVLREHTLARRMVEILALPS